MNYDHPLYRRSRYTCMIRREDVPDHTISQLLDTGQLVAAYSADERAEMIMAALAGGGTTPQLVLNYIRYGSTTLHLAEIEYGV